MIVYYSYCKEYLCIPDIFTTRDFDLIDFAEAEFAESSLYIY